jgi:hypothetical protein
MKRITKKQIRKVKPWLYWLPRILTILFICFIAMFSLDIFGNNYSFWETVVGLFMHNLITFVLIIFLILAWKWEIVGAIGYIFAGLLYILLMLFNTLRYPLQFYMISYSFIIAGPAIIIGILWWMNWVRKRK